MKPVEIIILALVLVLVSSLAGCSTLQGVPQSGSSTPSGDFSATPTRSAAAPELPTAAPLATTEGFAPAPTGQASIAVPGTQLLPADPTPRDPVGVPTPTTNPQEAPTVTIIAQLQATVMAEVRPTTTPDSTGMTPFGGIDNVSVIHLSSSTLTGDYWMAYSTGSRMFDNPPQQHFAVIYEHKDSGWRKISRVDLMNPDYLAKGSVLQVNIEPTHYWIAVESGVGAHGGCFDLLRFDGNNLKDEVSNCASDPAAGSVQDLDGDSTGEVVLNASDDYVFCYACGIRVVSFKVMRWNGTALAEIKAEKLATSTVAGLKQTNDQAVELFNHSLMKDAHTTIEKAYALDPTNETVKWNRALINLHADARRQAAMDSRYPLLANMFYGDYDAALNVLRPHTLDEILSGPKTSPLIVGTVAEGYEDALTAYITSTATLALGADPRLAGAYYLRGLALHLAGGHDSQVVADIEKAVMLSPTDKLFASTLARIKP
ncbi:MAG: hypothetical protein ABJA50_07155 [Chloroflexota bacterium]